MLLENIAMGKTLEIYVEREDYRYRLVSKVEDTNARRVCVTAIASNGRFFQFRPEDRIRLVYRDAEVIWEWDHVKAGLAKIDNVPVHYFQIVDKGKTFNRRNAYRVQLLEELLLRFYIIPGQKKCLSEVPRPPKDNNFTPDEIEEWLAQFKHPQSVKGMVKDVSENGIGIYTDHDFAISDEMFLSLPSDYGDLEIRAEVIRKMELKSSSGRFQFYYGCVLIQSDKRLLRYIYDLQREKLKKQKEMEMDRNFRV